MSCMQLSLQGRLLYEPCPTAVSLAPLCTRPVLAGDLSYPQTVSPETYYIDLPVRLLTYHAPLWFLSCPRLTGGSLLKACAV
jgi:hypothetical protein